MKLVTVSEMQQIERGANESGLTYEQMMENAGRGLADAVDQTFDEYRERGVLGLVGSGNNGGDTLVALDYLAQRGWKAAAYIVRPRPAGDPLQARLLRSGGKIQYAEQDADFHDLQDSLQQHAVILDGVLGTGIHLPLKSEVGEVLEFARRFLAGLEDHPVVAVDCPSGIDLDSGEAAPQCIPAELTVTMAAVKMGMLKFPAFKLLGKLEVAGIGLAEGEGSTGVNPEAWQQIKRFVPDREDVRRMLPDRPIDAHKGTFGTAMVVGGSTNYIGAVLLAGEAAYRSGAGLVSLAVPQPVQSALAGQFPEAVWVLLPDEQGAIASNAAEILQKNLGRATALLVGPGLGLERSTEVFLDRLTSLSQASWRGGMGFVRQATADSSQEAGRLPPLVIDADGLKLLARLENWPSRLPSQTVLTPHPGEMSILTGLKTDEIQTDRLGVAERFSRDWGHVVVLKGAFTVIAGPDGRTAVIPVATPALARAGTGDVLSGLITGLRAQGVDGFDAAVAGAWIHAQAGLWAADALGNTASVLASDVVEGVIAVLSDLAV